MEKENIIVPKCAIDRNDAENIYAKQFAIPKQLVQQFVYLMGFGTVIVGKRNLIVYYAQMLHRLAVIPVTNRYRVVTVAFNVVIQETVPFAEFTR